MGRVPAGGKAAAHADVDHAADVDRLFPEVAGHVQFVMDGTGIVDEDVHPPLFGQHAFEQGGDLGIVCMVALHGNAPAPGGGDFLSRLQDRAGHRGIAFADRAPGDIDRAAVVA